jgi:hypothetical protein
VLDTPISAAADVCCYGVAGAVCLPFIVLYAAANSSQPHQVFGR